ncbi:UNVERIFIED_CONTAM: hypothetical protein GTU68_008590 [Idotea baltica]|nr:hypothetical protein [Idotea baltica]
MQRFAQHAGTRNAAALTYTTLFAVVPMLTVLFTVLASVSVFTGIDKQIQQFIFSNLVPSAEETIQTHLVDFTNQAKQLTIVGIAALAVTAFLMLKTIEKTFNSIWNAPARKRDVTSFLLYWAILSLGPLLLGAGFAIGTYLTSLTLISNAESVVGIYRVMPMVFSAAAFTLIYMTVPNAMVPFKHALAGGCLAALLFELAKFIFRLYIELFPSYQLIYGAFAVIPLFLLWIYVCWLIVLFGAELVCNMSFSSEWAEQAVPQGLMALSVLYFFYECQQKGLKLSYKDVLKKEWYLPEYQWREIIAFLENQKLISVSGSGYWVLSRDLSNYSLYTFIRDVPWPVLCSNSLPDVFSQLPWYDLVQESINARESASENIFGGSVASCFRGEEKHSF